MFNVVVVLQHKYRNPIFLRINNPVFRDACSSIIASPVENCGHFNTAFDQKIADNVVVSKMFGGKDVKPQTQIVAALANPGTCGQRLQCLEECLNHIVRRLGILLAM